MSRPTTTIAVAELQGIRVITLAGPFERDDDERLRATLRGTDALVIDVARCAPLSSTVLYALVRAERTRASGRLALVATPGSQAEATLRATGMPHQVAVVADVEEAVALVASAP